MLNDKDYKINYDNYNFETTTDEDVSYLKKIYWHTPDQIILNKQISIQLVYFRNYYKCIRKLSDAIDCNIVASDNSYYSGGMEMIYPPYKHYVNGNGKVYEYLNSIALRFNLDWKFNDNILEINCYDWPRVLKYLMPENRISKWQKEMKINSFLSFQSLIDIQSISTDATAVNIVDCPILEENYFAAYEKTPIEFDEFYNMLNAIQKQAMFSSTGLSLSNLNDQQYEAFHQIVKHIDNLSLCDFPKKVFEEYIPEGTLTINKKLATDEGRIVYTIKLTTPEKVYTVAQRIAAKYKGIEKTKSSITKNKP